MVPIVLEQREALGAQLRVVAQEGRVYRGALGSEFPLPSEALKTTTSRPAPRVDVAHETEGQV